MSNPAHLRYQFRYHHPERLVADTLISITVPAPEVASNPTAIRA